MKITIYHNPNCGTSRNALAAIRDAGHEPQIVEYLKNPLPRAKIVALLAQMRTTARNVIRRKEPLFAELGLGEKDVTEDELLDAMAEHPVLINRPIVVVEDKKGVTAQLCRPSELVKPLIAEASPTS